MGIHVADQTIDFLYALIFGGLLGVFYDIFRILRIAFPTRPLTVFIQDLSFWAVCAVVSFLFLLTNVDGSVRFFLLLGECIGATLYYFTVGSFVMKVAHIIIGAVKAVLGFVYQWGLLPIWRIFLWMSRIFLFPWRMLSEFVKNSLQRYKLRLKVRRLVLYNQYAGMIRKKTDNAATQGEGVYGTKKEKNKT